MPKFSAFSGRDLGTKIQTQTSGLLAAHPHAASAVCGVRSDSIHPDPVRASAEDI